MEGLFEPGEIETLQAFATRVNKNPRTVRRWTQLPDGLPFIRLGNAIYIRIPSAREWILKKEKRPNPRRTAAA